MVHKAMRWKPLLIVTFASLLLLAAGSTLLSQFSSRIDLVVVPVSVRDNNGFLLTGLGKDDFTVLEDKRQQYITSFSVDEHPLSAAIVIDDGISGAALNRVVPLLPAAVSAFKPGDEMTSFRYDHLVWRLSEFTSDPEEIRKSFSELKKIADSRPVEIEQRPKVYDKIEKKTPDIIKVIANLFVLGSIGAPNGTPGSPPTAPAPKPVPTSRTMHSAIYEAAMALQNRPKGHRKIILLVSDGAAIEPQISIVPGKTFHSFDKNAELLTKNGNEIEVYSVNTSGTLLEKEGGTLDAYARASGGDVYGGISTSDMEFAFKRIVEQARTHYVLGYVSNNVAPRQGVFRTIVVKSGDPDQKRKVTYRNGYIQFPIPQ